MRWSRLLLAPSARRLMAVSLWVVAAVVAIMAIGFVLLLGWADAAPCSRSSWPSGSWPSSSVRSPAGTCCAAWSGGRPECPSVHPAHRRRRRHPHHPRPLVERDRVVRRGRRRGMARVRGHSGAEPTGRGYPPACVSLPGSHRRIARRSAKPSAGDRGLIRTGGAGDGRGPGARQPRRSHRRGGAALPGPWLEACRPTRLRVRAATVIFDLGIWSTAPRLFGWLPEGGNRVTTPRGYR